MTTNEQLDGRSEISSTEPPEIGSASWYGIEYCNYRANDTGYDDAYKKLVEFCDTCNWDLLASIASEHRGGIKCQYIEKCAVGEFNLVRRLIFEDDVSWVVQVRVPTDALPLWLQRYPRLETVETEVAAMKFFKSRTSIPGPEVYAYSLDLDHKVGGPYMFLEYIHGTPASELRHLRKCDEFMYGTAEQDAKFRKQMARIQAETLQFTFDKIGSLRWSEETSEFCIGPDVQSGKGPWTCSLDYYRDAVTELLPFFTRGVGVRREGFLMATGVVLGHLLNIHAEERTGPFRLVNQSLAPHSLLVDEDFNIIGVTSVDCVGAVPLEVAAQYPLAEELEAFLPGVTDTIPDYLRIEKRRKPFMRQYRELLRECELELGRVGAPVASRMESLPTLLYRGFREHPFLGQIRTNSVLNWAMDRLQEYAVAVAEGQPLWRWRIFP